MDTEIKFYQLKETREIDGEKWHLLRWLGWWDSDQYYFLFKEIMEDKERAIYDDEERKLYIRDDYIEIIEKEIIPKYWDAFHSRKTEKAEKVINSFKDDSGNNKNTTTKRKQERGSLFEDRVQDESGDLDED